MSGARHGRAVEPDSFRGQFFRDMTISLGLVVIVTDIAGSLHDAGVISRATQVQSLWCLLVPFTVSYWHAGWRPAPPPPAGRARQVLTLAGAGLALTLWLAGSAAVAMLIAVGRLSWQDFPLAAAVGVYLSLSAACRSVRNWRSAPLGVPAPREDAEGRSGRSG